MTTTHVVLGKGPVGRALTAQLTATGARVVVVSRSGGQDAGPVTHEAADVTDAAALTRLTTGAATVTCCVNPPYHRWPTAWPPVVESLIEAGKRTGAVVVLAGNLYGYGPTHPRMAEDTPQDSTEAKGLARTRAWESLRAAHERGDVRATEVRASDYIGPDAGANSHAGDRFLKPLLAGKTVRPVGAVDQPHTFTYLPDFAAALAAAGATEAAWGRPWHAPSPEPVTFRALADRFAGAAGMGSPAVSPMPVGILRTLGVVVPMLRELAAVSYQFTAPFVVDSTRSQEVLGLRPTAWDEIVTRTLAAAGGTARGR